THAGVGIGRNQRQRRRNGKDCGEQSKSAHGFPALSKPRLRPPAPIWCAAAPPVRGAGVARRRHQSERPLSRSKGLTFALASPRDCPPAQGTAAAPNRLIYGTADECMLPNSEVIS